MTRCGRSARKGGLSTAPLSVRLSLARWLGPWGGEVVPPGTVRRSIQVPADPPFEAWLYRPERREVRGAWLIAPGLHFRGPTDPRLDRFCRVLAAAGFAVLSPFLADYMALTLSPRVIDHLDRAFEAFGREPEAAGGKPAIFSISFGSYPAMGVASRRGAAVGGLTLFGGYARFADIVRFSVSGRSDAFNQAVAFKNLGRFLPGAPADTRRLESAWLEFVTRVWNRPEMKVAERWKEEAKAVAQGLPAEERELFLIGTGALPGGAALAERALAAPDLPDLDPRPAGVTCPVSLFHGATDDVIPPDQSRILAEALGAKVRLTGLYAHGDRANGSFLSALVGEIGTLLSILEALASPATPSTR